MTTELLYLTNPYLYRQQAKVTEKASDEKGRYLITDITPAYPQGGGQESDIGYISLGVDKFRFNEVRFFEGIIKHYLDDGWEKFNKGEDIEIIVDINRRKRNSILHSAGHLVASVACKNISGLIPIKGHHFSDGSYVELSGELQSNIDEIKFELQTILNDEVLTDKIISYEMVTLEELKTSCPFIQPGLPPPLPPPPPPNKPLRIVNIETYFPMGCGGTHIQKLREITKLEITKLKSSKGIVRISYSCL